MDEGLASACRHLAVIGGSEACLTVAIKLVLTLVSRDSNPAADSYKTEKSLVSNLQYQ